MQDTKAIRPKTDVKIHGIPPANELAQSEEIFALLIDAVEDYAIFALDKNGIILTWNLGGQRLKGYQASEVIGAHFSLFYTQEDIDRHHPQHELELAEKNGKYEEEGWRLKKDGTRFWANVVITALRSEDGSLRGFGKVTRDLTAKKMAYLELEQMVQARPHLRLVKKGIFSEFEPSKLPDLCRDTERQVDRLANLVNNMLDVSQATSETLDLSLSTFDLREAVGDVCRQMGGVLSSSGNMCSIVAPKKILGNWDRTRIEQVITNLLSNASKYAPAQPIEITLASEDNQALISIRDHGPGISKKDQARIFEPFERAKIGSEASGLGLGSGDGKMLTKSKVLVIEDDGDIRKNLKWLLESENFRVDLAENGKVALDMLHVDTDLPSVIILDMMMPVMDGSEFLEEQKKISRLAPIPVIILTADGRTDDKKGHPGAKATIKKPADADLIVETVRQFIA